MGGLRTGIKPVHIASASKMVTDFSGMPIQPHKVCLQHLTSMLPDMLFVLHTCLCPNQADVVVQFQTQQLSVTLLQIALYWLYYGYTMAMARLYYGLARPEF